jgi:hypothetical protein
MALTVLGLIALAITSPAIATDAERAFARCRMEYLKHEDALRWKENDFYKTCMRAEGFDFLGDPPYRLICLPNLEHCYGRPPEPERPLEPKNWLDRAKDWLNSIGK